MTFQDDDENTGGSFTRIKLILWMMKSSDDDVQEELSPKRMKISGTMKH